jgi:hypothetical protein
MNRIEQIARVCHDASASYCHSIGDHSQKPWDEAEEWQRQSAIRGVEYALANQAARASAQHEAWLADKVASGWKFGPVKDADKKEHPCMVPYEKLPVEQQNKDHLFRAIVGAFTNHE